MKINYKCLPLDGCSTHNILRLSAICPSGQNNIQLFPYKKKPVSHLIQTPVLSQNPQLGELQTVCKTVTSISFANVIKWAL